MKNWFIMIVAMLGVAACAGVSQKQNVYQTGQVQQAMKVKLATVIEVREVQIEARPTGAGTTAGMVTGATLAAGPHGTRGGVVEGVAGAVVGGIAGSLVEKAASEKIGVEILYQVDGATEVEALVQEKDEQDIRPGDRIRLLQGSFAIRAVKLPRVAAK